ncbi:MAG: hypothetical protein L0154_13770 [Chloroflexi bacterium]|nr:hypothetical protein [Chloroflexota bacterium]
MTTAIVMLGDDLSALQPLRAVAANELIGILQKAEIEHIVVSSPSTAWLEHPVQIVQDSPNFHFGQALHRLIRQTESQDVMYFGGASAPLMTVEQVRSILPQLDDGVAVTNNLHSSDWIALRVNQAALAVIEGCERDNSLAWELRESAGYMVRTMSERSFDLDTPADFALIGLHPDCPPRLRQAIQQTTLLQQIPVQRVVDVLKRDGSQVALIGRVAPVAWQAIGNVTRCWIRVYAEERGMVASQRVERGEVTSLLGELLDVVGPVKFWEHLSKICDAVIMDSRVLMARRGYLPDPAQRYASDLGQVERIDDEWLAAFTKAAHKAPIPVLLGGHSVVSGGLMLLADIIARK